MSERPTPLLIKRECGGWLAISPPELQLSIGTEGYTPSQAKERWDAAYDRFLEILKLPPIYEATHDPL
jgi:hypothetical protein